MGYWFGFQTTSCSDLPHSRKAFVTLESKVVVNRYNAGHWGRYFWNIRVKDWEFNLRNSYYYSFLLEAPIYLPLLRIWEKLIAKKKTSKMSGLFHSYTGDLISLQRTRRAVTGDNRKLWRTPRILARTWHLKDVTYDAHFGGKQLTLRWKVAFFWETSYMRGCSGPEASREDDTIAYNPWNGFPAYWSSVLSTSLWLLLEEQHVL